MQYRMGILVCLASLLALAGYASAQSIYNGGFFRPGQLSSRYEVIGGPKVVAVHLTHVPGTDKYLYLARASCGTISGGYDLAGRRSFDVSVGDAVFCAGHTVTAGGAVLVAGGHIVDFTAAKWKTIKPENLHKFRDGTKSIREYNPRKNPNALVKLTNMASGRWYPTLTLLPDGLILIMGGTTWPNKKEAKFLNRDFEVFNPGNPSGTKSYPLDPVYLNQYKQGYYPFNLVLPTGDVFNYCKRVSRVIVGSSGKYRKTASGAFVAAPDKPGPEIAVYPHTGTFALLALKPPYNKVEMVVYGGAPPDNCMNTRRLASSKSYRLSITWNQANPYAAPIYQFSNWQAEETGIPRLMGDATVLPNGKVVLQNGAQTGCAGDSAKAGQARAMYPAFWAEQYDPDAPLGSRYKQLAASTIARMYHSVAVLTTNGTILVAGCDVADPTITNAAFYSKNPAVEKNCEFRNEIFYPPNSLSSSAPYIDSVNGNGSPSSIVEVGYGETLTVRLSGRGSRSATSASIVAPSSTTHSYNMNQRVVFLSTSNADGTVTVRTPPHPFIAPPQMYMLFMLNGDAYGAARWIKLVDRTGAGKRLPAV